MYIDLNNALVFMMVMLRMTSMLVMNPIFGRRNIPTMVNMGLSFMLAVVITSSMPFPTLPDPTLLTFAFMAIMELMVGFTAGFIVNLFLTIMIVGGSVVDMQMGLAMAQVFDPGSNASIPLSATIFNAMFILTFFVTNNHLTFINMTAQTFNVIPLGVIGITPQALFYIPNLFSTIILFAVKLCLPIVVIQVITTLSVGVVMRIVPQINIFVLNIQIKLLLGIMALFLLVAPLMGFMENLWTISFERIVDMWRLMIPSQ